MLPRKSEGVPCLARSSGEQQRFQVSEPVVRNLRIHRERRNQIGQTFGGTLRLHEQHAQTVVGGRVLRRGLQDRAVRLRGKVELARQLVSHRTRARLVQRRRGIAGIFETGCHDGRVQDPCHGPSEARFTADNRPAARRGLVKQCFANV